MKDLAENIRRIAKQPKLKGAHGSQQPREPIPGKVTPYATGAFSTASNGGSSSNGETNTDTNPNGSDSQDDTDTFNPDDPATWTQGGGSGSSETGDQTGYQDFESVVNGDAGPQSPPDNTTDSTSDTGYTGGSVNGFTGMTDCSSGKCINIHLNGEFPPPDGWDDANSPPPVEGWVAGTNAIDNGSTSLSSGDTTVTFEAVTYHYTLAAADANALAVCTAAKDEIVANEGGTWDVQPQGGTGYVIRQHFGTWQNRYVRSFSSASCSIDTDPFCPSVAPTETEWPTDGCYDLALIDGSFQTNQYDSEAPANAGGSIVDVCYGSGKTGRVYVTAQGGVMITETSGGVPTGTVTVYASDGTFQAAGDSTPQFMDQYLPK